MSELTQQERRTLAARRESRRAAAERLGRYWTERIRREEEEAAQYHPRKVAFRTVVGLGSALAVGGAAHFFGLGKLYAAQISAVAIAIPYAGNMILATIRKRRANRTRVVYESPPRRVRRHTT